ncbi:MAG: DUF1993 domain-containing protein [Terricaulis sp.]
MPFSLYEVTVPSFRQTLGAMVGLLEKAEAHCAAKSLAASELIEARLFEDMFPFNYQIKSTVTHSVGALEALAGGVFSPDFTPPPATFADLRHKLAGALQTLEAFTPGDINAHEGRDMRFELKDFKLPFTAENFLTSFSLPNFYFHATTAYDILRHEGVMVGKRDYVGQLRLKV